MNFINKVVKYFLKQRLSNIRYYRQQPCVAQKKWFNHLIQQGQQTQWGQKMGFSSIRTIEDFQSLVPLQNYESLQPYIKEMMQGKSDILWPGQVHWYAQSSGTTHDKSKFIPIPRTNRKYCHYKASQDILASYCYHHPYTNLFTGKGLVLGGSHSISQLNQNTYYGDLSAVLLQNMGSVPQWFQSPELSVALMEDWEQKLELMAQSVLREKITNISGVPTWTLVLIKRLLQMTGKNQLKEILPQLELYIHGGVNFSPYESQFKKWAGSSLDYYQTYNASEGFFAFQDRPGRKDMLLLTDHGQFYEFIPLENINQFHPPAYTLEEVEVGHSYALVISANNGLWRYIVGDTITFTSTQPYRIKVTGRIKHFINAFGEEVIVEDAETALATACEETGAQVKEYTAGPIYFSNNNKGGHEWWIEFETPPADMDEFTTILDRSLQSNNSDYEAKRYKSIALTRPIIRSVNTGTFHRWLKSKNKLGGQHKVPRLANHRQYIEEIAAFDSQS